MSFREDINALRGIAVLAVVLFHFRIAGFDGGFVGVDIFFVISGYLMTAIIIGRLEQGRFSLLDFYAARARRILPALACLCLALMLFGFVYLPLSDYRELLRTIQSSLLFYSNMSFAGSANYFDTPLQENWLLHTWSLSVEWQFYLLYPLLLLALFKWCKDALKWVLLLLALCSLLASILVTPSNPTVAFYILPTRAWELLAGGLVFLFPRATAFIKPALLEIGAGLLIALAVVFFNSRLQWPGALALVPVLGALWVLYSRSQSFIINNRFLQFTGTISYSVYLWHWPIAVLLYLCGLIHDPLYTVGGILLSFVLGWMSYRFIEIRMTKGISAPLTVGRYALLVVVLSGLAASMASWVKHYPEIRFAYREPERPSITSELYELQCNDNPYKAWECQLGQGRISTILLGDSHAQTTAAAIQSQNPEAALAWALGGCPLLSDFSMEDKDKALACKAYLDEKTELLRTRYQGIPLILFNRGGLYSDLSRKNSFSVSFSPTIDADPERYAFEYARQFSRMVCRFNEANPVAVVRPIPEMPFNIYKGIFLRSRIFNTYADITDSIEHYRHRNAIANQAIDQAQKTCGIQILDPVTYLCPENRCIGSRDNVPLYFDDNHLIDAGNLILKPMFNLNY